VSSTKPRTFDYTRQWQRFSHLREVSLCYEGKNEVLSIHPPDVSPKGMFLNTATSFPEGTVLKVQFRLAKSNHRVEARCEVRYCVPGIGVGVEFVDITATDEKAIEAELDTTLRKTNPEAKMKRRARSK